MTHEQIQTILDNASEDLCERLFETLLNEVNSDEEPYTSYWSPPSKMKTQMTFSLPSAAGVWRR